MVPIEIDKNSGTEIPDVKIHLLPIKIARNGKANVHKFFNVEEDNDILLKGIVCCVHSMLMLQGNQH
jgi:hypothetical protein